MCTLTVFDVFGLWWCFELKSDDGISRFLLFFSLFCILQTRDLMFLLSVLFVGKRTLNIT